MTYVIQFKPKNAFINSLLDSRDGQARFYGGGFKISNYQYTVFAYTLFKSIKRRLSW